jgi:hypothetical protein
MKSLVHIERYGLRGGIEKAPLCCVAELRQRALDPDRVDAEHERQDDRRSQSRDGRGELEGRDLQKPARGGAHHVGVGGAGGLASLVEREDKTDEGQEQTDANEIARDASSPRDPCSSVAFAFSKTPRGRERWSTGADL